MFVTLGKEFDMRKQTPLSATLGTYYEGFKLIKRFAITTSSRRQFFAGNQCDLRERKEM